MPLRMVICECAEEAKKELGDSMGKLSTPSFIVEARP